MNVTFFSEGLARYRGDLCILCCLGIIAFLGSSFLAQQLDNVLVSASGIDFWFQSDAARVFWNMSDPASDHNRATVHPLFSVFTTPFVLGLRVLLDTDRLTAVRLTMSLAAGAWTMLMYVLLRLIGLLRADALLFSFLALCSSTFIFWFSVPETFPFGSLAIVFSLVLLARVPGKKPPGEVAYVAAGIFTLSFTVTNWMTGLLVSFLGLPWKKALRSNLIALVFVSILSFCQRYVFTAVPFFVGKMDKNFASSSDEINFLFMDEAGGPIRIVFSFLHHSVIMPAIQYADKLGRTDWKILSVQFSNPFSGGIAGAVAGVFWLVLLGAGLWSMWKVQSDLRVKLGVFLALVSQLALHLVYGDETFLYAMHYLPMLIIVAAYGTLTPMRKPVLIIACIVCIGAGINNITQFFWAVHTLNMHFHVQGF